MARLSDLIQRLRGAQGRAMIGTMLRFGVTGVLGVLTHLAVLYALTRWAHVWYLHSVIAAWFAAFCVSFILQRQWTFGRSGGEGAKRQLAAFVILFLANMGIDRVLLQLLVERLGANFMVAQFGLLVAIAIWNFFIMRLIFRPTRAADAG